MEYSKYLVPDAGSATINRGRCEGMKVTDVRIRRLSNEGKMRAIVSVTLNDQFVVHDVRIIEGNNGLFVAMPSKRTPSGEFKDIAHPINPEARQVIQDAVLVAYKRQLEQMEEEGITAYQ